MNDLVFSLNVTIPVFLTMAAGFFLHEIGSIDDVFAGKLNRFVFRVALPVSLFRQLAVNDFRSVWDTRFAVFCFVVSAICIAASFLIGRKLYDRSTAAEFTQAAYRSSQALLGVAYIQNMYGRDSVMTALMIAASVPLYNIMAVIVLMNGKEDGTVNKKDAVRGSILGIITNPIILGIVSGMIYSFLRLPLPGIPSKVLSNIGGLASPLGLLALGASIDPRKVGGKIKPAVLASVLKLVGWAAVFLPIAILIGFREEQLAVLIIMFGAPTTVTSFVMARSYGHEGTVSSNTVVITTLVSAFTLTMWIFLVRGLGMI